MKPLVLTLMGPTACGKTQLAIELVQQSPLEIISVDSAMIYRGMDIGTGKPTPEEQAIAPHHLIDILDPHESYSAADFCRDAFKHIQAIHARDKIPLLVGGTMMYFDALIHGLSSLPNADEKIRAALEEQKNQIGLEGMHQALEKIDPEAAQQIHPNDPQRLLRALEVYQITGQPISKLQKQKIKLLENYNVKQFAIFPEDRVKLHNDIETRFLNMLSQGFIAEVQQLKDRGDLNLTMPSMRCVGYRQIWEYLDGKYDEVTMQEKALAATRQLAKRQMTWLRSWEEVQFFETAAEVKQGITTKCRRKF